MLIARPRRATHTYTQHLIAEPSRVFPLLCPVREADWIDGWDPVAVWSESGIAEQDCVFLTSAEPHDAVWVVTRHEPDAGVIEMLKVTPEVTVCRLRIALTGEAAGTAAEITYTHTSIGPSGDEFVERFTKEYYGEFMADWESRLNHYLSTGTRLIGEREMPRPTLRHSTERLEATQGEHDLGLRRAGP